MTTKEIDAMRHKFRIPGDIPLRPLKEGELATDPPRGWVAVHEHQFKCGLSLLLHPWVQSTLSGLNVAIGQVTPNMWKQLLGLFVIWELSGNGWPHTTKCCRSTGYPILPRGFAREPLP